MSTALTLMAALSVLLTVVAHLCVRVVMRRRAAPAAQPPVSILKPLKGVDDDLERNLASFARQDYSDFEIVFGAEDPADPALAIARRVQRRYPRVRIMVVAGASALGRNPKVSNLATLSRAARHELWLISDSNVRVRRSYLRETVAELQPGVGLVTNMFAGVGETTLGALLENQQLSTWIPAGLAGSQVLTGRACVVGKSMLFRRAILDQLGGWSAFADVLAEDWVMGARVERLGLKTITSRHVIHTVNASWDLGRFLNRHLRWSQIRRRVCLPAYLAEPVLNPVLWSVLAALGGAPVAGACGVLAKVASDALLARATRGRGFRLHQLLLIPPKDLLLFGLWVVGAFRRRVTWRGNPLWIGPGSVLLAEPAERRVEPAGASG